ncbi:Protein sly1 [Blattella germanica]|nr:Protein sly1 [Blattella germanica]
MGNCKIHTQNRDPIPDVPAVYFCLPTEENLGRIGQDLQNNVYDAYHLNFISPISRQRLEDLAAAALQANCVSQIQKVFDQYLNFISLEDDMFILKHQNSEAISYYAINRGEIKDTEMETIMDTIVDSLFSVFATLGTVPVIRSPRGNAAEMVAEKLDKKLRENLRDTRNSLFSVDATAQGGGHFSFQRPLLIVLDRNVDMATPLHHTWTYQALAHDVLDLTLNRVVVEENVGRSPAGGAKVKTRACDLDSRDRFWMAHKGSPFPIVAEAIQEELEQYRSSEEEVKRLKASMAEFDRYATALQNADCDLNPLTYIKRWKAYAKMAATPNQYVGGGTKTVSMFSKLVSQGSSFVMEGVKNLVVKRHNLPVTRIVDELMEMKTSQETEEYRYFDPKQLRMTDSSQIPRNRTPFQEAIVFVVGGGNYIEYQNLVDYTKLSMLGEELH